jgi:hypothetical protein
MGELIGRENFLVDLVRKRRDQKGTVLLIELRSPDLAPCDWDENPRSSAPIEAR